MYGGERHDETERALIARVQVVGSLERRDRIEAYRVATSLVQEVVLPEDLNRPIARAMDADLRTRGEAVTQLEADLRARIKSEKVRRQIAEVSLPQRTGEPVRDAERQLVHRHSQRRRQRRKVEVGLEGIHPNVRIRLRVILDGCPRLRRGRVGGRRLGGSGGGKARAETRKKNRSKTRHRGTSIAKQVPTRTDGTSIKTKT